MPGLVLAHAVPNLSTIPQCTCLHVCLHDYFAVSHNHVDSGLRRSSSADQEISRLDEPEDEDLAESAPDASDDDARFEEILRMNFEDLDMDPSVRLTMLL